MPGRRLGLTALLLLLALVSGCASVACAQDGLAIGEVRAGALDGGPALAVEISSEVPLGSPSLTVSSAPPLRFGAARIAVDAGGRGGLVLLPLEGAEGSLVGRTVSLTLTDGQRHSERVATVAPGFEEPRGAARLVAAAFILGTAFLGGLILNLMPCVLPVLSLKLFAITRHGGGAPARLRASFLATAAGILASFAVLAFGLIALRKTGGLIGWGIQFQQPGFIAGMAVVTALFACSLFGLFELRLPATLANRFGGPTQAGLAGDVATGFFATLLATPCSAPFVGTAVGFALVRESSVILAVFAALGFGFCAPYLVLAAFPRLIAWMPKPGRWMLWLRAALGLMLAGTALWLLSILAAQVTPAVMAGVVVLLIVLAALLAVGRIRPGRAVAAGAAVLALAAVALPVAAGIREDAGSIDGKGPVAWVPFERGAARTLVAQGRTVFVVVGADWCPTCQLNERVVIEREPVAGRLGNEVVPMKADWTRPDRATTLFMASYGRYAIPFTIVYGPGAPGGIQLPDLLTSETVLEALDRAGRRPTASLNSSARSTR